MFSFRKDFCNPALFFSGGVESTLMYYLYATQTELPLTLYVVNRNNNPIDRAIRVYNEINKCISTIHELKIQEIPEMESFNQIPYLYNLIKDNHDIILYGANKYPDDESIMPIHSKSIIDTQKIKEDPYTYAPFLDMDKSEVVSMYLKLGIEDILKITHSCGENLTYPCKECFNCREREWAYRKLNLPIARGT